MRIRALIAGLLVLAFAPVGAGQGRVARYDLDAMSMLDVSPNIRIKKVMGQVGTFMVGDFTAGWKNTPHHHTHEQINVGISGSFNIVTPSTPHVVSRLRGLLIPPDVLHGNDVSAVTANPILIEFQPVRRLDFPPEREKVEFKRAAAPVTAPSAMDVDFRSDSSSWRPIAAGVRSNGKKGVGAAVSAWEISATAKAPFDLQPQIAGAELFIHVLEGGADITIGSERQASPAGTLLVVAPGSPGVQVRPTGVASVLLVFEAAKAQ